MSVFTKNIDSRPYTGLKCVGFLGEATAKRTLERYHITKGKKYRVLALQGYGDVEDVIFENDVGEMSILGSFNFEDGE